MVMEEYVELGEPFLKLTVEVEEGSHQVAERVLETYEEAEGGLSESSNRHQGAYYVKKESFKGYQCLQEVEGRLEERETILGGAVELLRGMGNCLRIELPWMDADRYEMPLQGEREEYERRVISINERDGQEDGWDSWPAARYVVADLDDSVEVLLVDATPEEGFLTSDDVDFLYEIHDKAVWWDEVDDVEMEPAF